MMPTGMCESSLRTWRRWTRWRRTDIMFAKGLSGGYSLGAAVFSQVAEPIYAVDGCRHRPGL